MRDVRTPLPARLLMLFEGRGQIVEVTRQSAKLVVARRRDALRKVPRGQSTRASGQRTYRCQQPSRQRERQQQRTDKYRDTGGHGTTYLRLYERQIGCVAQLRYWRQSQRTYTPTFERDWQNCAIGGHVWIARDAFTGGIQQQEARHQVGRFTRPRWWRWTIPVRRTLAIIRGWPRATFFIPRARIRSLQRRRFDEIAEPRRIAAQKIPATVFAVGGGKPRVCGSQALQRYLIQIAKKSAPETLLLPSRKAKQRHAAEHGESKKQALPQVQSHKHKDNR